MTSIMILIGLHCVFDYPLQGQLLGEGKCKGCDHGCSYCFNLTAPPAKYLDQDYLPSL